MIVISWVEFTWEKARFVQTPHVSQKVHVVFQVAIALGQYLQKTAPQLAVSFKAMQQPAHQPIARNQSGAPAKPFVRAVEKVGRNDPCSCGSGRKFKKCCGANA